MDLGKYRNSEDFNFVSLRGGKFLLKSSFMQSYRKKYPAFTPVNSPSLVFRNRKDVLCPIFCDLDLVQDKNVPIPNKVFIEFGKMCAKSSKYIVTRRPGAYRANNNVWKNGCHVFILGEFSTEQSKALRHSILASPEYKNLLTKFTEYSVTRVDFDRRLSDRSNGLVLLGDYKPDTLCSPYYICYYETERAFGWQFKIENRGIFEKCLVEMYDWIWVQKMQGSFNLQQFLKSTKHVPDNEEYRTLIPYFSSTSLDATEISKQCNAAWRPGPCKLQETSKFVKRVRAKGVYKVKEARIIDYLNAHSLKWSEEDIFGKRVSLLYNEHSKFSRGIWSKNDIEFFLIHAVDFVYSNKIFTWRYSTKRFDKSGNKLMIFHRMFSKDAPFSGKDNFKIQIFPNKSEIVKQINELVLTKKISATAASKFLPMLEKNISDKNAYELVNGIKGIQTKTVAMSDILFDLMMNYKIRRYAKVEFIPFSKHKPIISDETLNTFDGFVFDNYRIKNEVVIKNTRVYKYLVEAFGDGNDENTSLLFLLDLVGHMVQYPEIRSERLIVLHSTEEGVGKSFLYVVLSKIFEGFTSFHDNLSSYLGRFNINDHSKKIIFIDDIMTASRSMTRNLYPKVTCKTTSYERKNETAVVMQEFAEIWITSNETSALYTTSNSRRQLFIPVYPRLLQNRKFFKALTLELENLDVCASLFKFFKTRDISNFDLQGNPDSAHHSISVSACMPKSHKFIIHFFATDNWYSQYNFTNWLEEFEVTNDPYSKTRISTKRFYLLYKCYLKEYYPQSKPRNLDTFIEECRRVDVLAFEKRRRVNKRKLKCVELVFSSISKKVKRDYNITMQPFAQDRDFDGFTKSLEKYMSCQW